MSLRIGGLTPMTTIDFPGHMAAVLYCRGCNFRCSYCHNEDLQCTKPTPGDINWEDALNFLGLRVSWLDGVVFSGGEPLLQSALPEAIRDVKALGYAAALHTAGPAPERLKKNLPLVDWIGFDVKTLFENYETVTGVPDSGKKAWHSLEILLESEKPYEVRTTVDPAIIPPAKLLWLGKQLKNMGVNVYRIQESSLMKEPYPEETENELKEMFPDFDIRRAPPKEKSSPRVAA